jgi:integrase/recombinase XerC
MTSASAVISQFLDDLRLAKKSPNTIKTYQQGLRLFLEIVGKNDELSEKNFIKFLQRTADYKSSSHSTYRVAVSRLYEYFSPDVPTRRLIDRYGRRREKRFITYKEEALEDLLSYMETLRWDLRALRDRALILTLADTGLRISEACSLSRGDLDFRKKRALIVGKGDKPGIIRFSPRSLDAIRLYLASRSYIDGKSGKALESLPLFARHDPGAGGKIKKLRSGGAWGAIRSRAKEAGIEEGVVTPHKFRHYFVTRILRATNGNLAKAAELARHEDPNTTKRYGHLSEGELDRTYEEIFT